MKFDLDIYNHVNENLEKKKKEVAALNDICEYMGYEWNNAHPVLRADHAQIWEKVITDVVKFMDEGTEMLKSIAYLTDIGVWEWDEFSDIFNSKMLSPYVFTMVHIKHWLERYEKKWGHPYNIRFLGAAINKDVDLWNAVAKEVYRKNGAVYDKWEWTNKWRIAIIVDEGE